VVTFYRRLPKFDYIQPKTLAETLNLLANSNNGKYRVYAGGTDLIPKLKRRAVVQPEVLVDLKGIPNLDYVDYDDQDGLRIGALATIRSVATSPVVSEKLPILSQAAGSIAFIQVQNRGTIAGNICNAVPSADSAPAISPGPPRARRSAGAGQGPPTEIMLACRRRRSILGGFD